MTHFILRKLSVAIIAIFLSVFFVGLFFAILSYPDTVLFDFSKIKVVAIRDLSFPIAPCAILTAWLIEGRYTASWKRNLAVNAVGFTLALIFVSLILSWQEQATPLSWQNLRSFAKQSSGILAIGWVVMGIPFCFFMTIFGVFWARILKELPAKKHQ